MQHGITPHTSAQTEDAALHTGHAASMHRVECTSGKKYQRWWLYAPRVALEQPERSTGRDDNTCCMHRARMLLSAHHAACTEHECCSDMHGSVCSGVQRTCRCKRICAASQRSTVSRSTEWRASCGMSHTARRHALAQDTARTPQVAQSMQRGATGGLPAHHRCMCAHRIVASACADRNSTA
jgi:hypothetical protein